MSKDYFSLLSIDHLIDAMIGHAVFFMVVAIVGYHQILMEESDVKRSYQVMPFNLKDARAIYQKL